MGFTYCYYRFSQHRKCVCACIRACVRHHKSGNLLAHAVRTCVQRQNHSNMARDCTREGGRKRGHLQVTTTNSLAEYHHCSIWVDRWADEWMDISLHRYKRRNRYSFKETKLVATNLKYVLTVKSAKLWEVFLKQLVPSSSPETFRLGWIATYPGQFSTVRASLFVVGCQKCEHVQ